MKRKVVIGIGELLWDILPEGKQLGGAPCNFAFHTLQVGCEAYVVSAVGNEVLGKEILETVSDLNLSNEFIQTNSYPTGNVSIFLSQNGQPDYTIHKKVAWDFIEWNSSLLSLAKKTDAVCFGSLAQRGKQSRETIVHFLDNVNDDCLRVFDINLRQDFYNDEIIGESLEYANILKLNEEELPVLAAIYSLEGNVESQLMELIERFDLKYVAYTMGGNGSIVQSKNESNFLKAPKVEVIDTVGAGDSFTATFVTGLLHEIPLEEIHEKATEIAAYVCTCAGATPLINEELLSSNWY